ncbi:hypothetical protein B0H10DRAFT_12835 [Mycena sp. CBHHK59/15]|nr:hypothetical protein B0H10DRAFT_12835 [Mycena sp. CBHHK59/15]
MSSFTLSSWDDGTAVNSTILLAHDCNPHLCWIALRRCLQPVSTFETRPTALARRQPHSPRLLRLSRGQFRVDRGAWVKRKVMLMVFAGMGSSIFWRTDRTDSRSVLLRSRITSPLYTTVRWVLLAGDNCLSRARYCWRVPELYSGAVLQCCGARLYGALVHVDADTIHRVFEDDVVDVGCGWSGCTWKQTLLSKTMLSALLMNVRTLALQRQTGSVRYIDYLKAKFLRRVLFLLDR